MNPRDRLTKLEAEDGGSRCADCNDLKKAHVVFAGKEDTPLRDAPTCEVCGFVPVTIVLRATKEAGRL